MKNREKTIIGSLTLVGLLLVAGEIKAASFGSSGDAIRTFFRYISKAGGDLYSDESIPNNWGGPRCVGIDLAPSYLTALSSESPLSDDPQKPFLLTRRTFKDTNEWDHYEVDDQCAGGFGDRYLIRFSASAMNLGSQNWHIGDPFATIPDNPDGTCSNGNPYCGLYDFFASHGNHLHSDVYHYRLVNADTGAIIITKKIGIGTIDTSPLGKDSPAPQYYGFPTQNGEGITSGWADDYPWYLPCQYVDVTDVPPGNYKLQVFVDYGNKVAECNENNNMISVDVKILTKNSVNYVKDQGAIVFNLLWKTLGKL